MNSKISDSDSELILGKRCVKCIEPAVYAGIDPMKAVYCKICFLHMVKSKFRSTISKRRIFKDGEPRETMVVFDGSSSSAFLLHQIEDAVKQISFKRLMICPTVLVLISVNDQSAITIIEQRVACLKSIIPNTPWYIIHLSSGLKQKLSLEDNGRCCNVDMIAQLEELLSSCHSSTAREEVSRILKERTLQKAALSLGITKVMLPHDGDFLGRLALTQICLGRGGIVSELTSVVDKRSCGITFVRPLRDISLKEISIVNHLEGYEKTAIRMDINDNFTYSVHSVTSDFVDGLLSEGFKSTIPTVLSIANKIHIRQGGRECPLCQFPQMGNSSLCESCQEIVDEVKFPELINILSS